MNPEQQADYARKYELQLVRNREHQKAYYERNKEEIKRYQREHYRANRDRIIHRVKTYQNRTELVQPTNNGWTPRTWGRKTPELWKTPRILRGVRTKLTNKFLFH